MADLINRDELIKELEAHCNNVSGEVDSIIGQTYRMAYQHAIEVVKIYPPAYDVEKVVTELTNMKKDHANKCTQVSIAICNRYSDCGVCLMDRTIDIVKTGGDK